MKMKRIAAAALAIGAWLSPALAADPVGLEYEVSLTANASTGDHAPYMIGSWNYGRITGASGIWNDGRIEKRTDLQKRFSWGAGVEYMAGYGSAAEYDRYDAAHMTMGRRGVRQAPVRLQQLYGEVKYRGVYLLAGMKERRSLIVDGDLSSGDLTRSNNARPIPGVAAGFVDFQDIPLTGGWVQIDGEIMYGRFTDSSFREKTFNYYTGELWTGNWYTYKRCYFRTRPSMPFSVTVGMQTAGEFAGRRRYYYQGELRSDTRRPFKVKDIFEMFFPLEGSGEDYYKGNSLGSWDFKARYNFRDGSALSAYFEWPWEDGSGIGKATGWDGLWGLQYDFGRQGAVTKVLLEYFDFTNQSGPIHWAPGDSPGTDMTNPATGGDSYYDNVFYGPYANYGMSIGTPFVVSPLYNSDGVQTFVHSRARGFHAAVEGTLRTGFDYRVKLSYQKAGGTGRIPAVRRLTDTSASVAVRWRPVGSMPGFCLTAQAAFDAGKLRGNNFGALVGISYTGLLNIVK